MSEPIPFRIRGDINYHRRDYLDDIARIQRVVQEKGYDCYDDLAQRLWEVYSDSMSAGWLGLPDSDEELFECVSSYIVPIEVENEENE